ncbi:uncharacterized protein LOC122266060 isoform X2 [Penaeus japonicus]|uniref:uncharacterized protein LOC122266060 isoform X2 n=1 Tax=Penaeus japonicus TaxID=27405 RepID=UPI001C70D59D|nr:uncharacterized protein LOC122266060 isoform X2 [Penaeus japonicus]
MQDRQRWSLSEFVFLLIITESALVCLGQTTPTDNELQDFPATGVRACCAPEKEETPEGEKEWISINYPVCGLSQILMLAKNFSVKPSGNLFLFHDGVSTYPPEEYCIADCLSSTNESEVRESLSKGWINGSKRVVLCIHYECWWKFYVFDPLLLSVTSASLAVALITYISIADLRKRQSNHSLICMLSALLLAFTTTLAIRFLRTVFSDHLCRLAVALNTIGVLAGFSWLNIVCYEVWTWVPQVCPRTSVQQGKTRWWFYHLYGWGFPVLWVTIASVADLCLSADHALHPGFIRNSCYFKDSLTTWIYRNGPVLMMLLVNLFFFAHLVITLVKQLRERDRILQNRRKPKYRIILCELVVELQGLWIFFVAACNMPNRRLIQRAWGRCTRTSRREKTAVERNSSSTSKLSEGKTSARPSGIRSSTDTPTAKTLTALDASEVGQTSDNIPAVSKNPEPAKATNVAIAHEPEAERATNVTSRSETSNIANSLDANKSDIHASLDVNDLDIGKYSSQQASNILLKFSDIGTTSDTITNVSNVFDITNTSVIWTTNT